MPRPLTDAERKADYIGDGAYMLVERGDVRLFTSDGEDLIHEIVLDATMIDTMLRQAKWYDVPFKYRENED